MGKNLKPDRGKACATIGIIQRHTSFFYLYHLKMVTGLP